MNSSLSRRIACLTVSGLFASAAWGAAPSARPALPAGHPDIGAAGQGGAAPNPALPPGHPAVGNPTRPTGPAATVGTITLRVTQGTKGGPAVARDPVVVDLYNRGRVLQSLTGTLGADGTATFDKVPLAVPFQPLVRVTHAGVEFTAVGNVMDGYRAGQQVRMTVYERTDAPPAWPVAMRHVIIEPRADGAVGVTEILSVQNPGDRAWANPAGTLALPFPAGADRFEFAAGQTWSVRRDEGRLVQTKPLLPGASEFQVSYTVPVANGKARVALTAPAAVGNMMVFVTDNGGATVQAEGLQPAGRHDMGELKAQIFSAANLKAGQAAVLTVTVPQSATTKPARQAGAAAGASSGRVAKVVAGVGGGLGLVAGIGYVLAKPSAAAAAPPRS
jgi:hypothetical protein